jgi:hypothetical protein
MGSPHMRRRYRATGTRSGLAYLFLILGAATLYVGQRVYSNREQAALNILTAHVDAQTQALDRLTAGRDSLLALAVIRPKAEALGLRDVAVEQLARLPLTAPPLRHYGFPASPVRLSQTVSRIWNWLDAPRVESQEVAAHE